ncbi:MAG: DUF2059 domain-containing protein [Balneolia bacterium]|nr:DUF2059 domain-containing protein [Balneolia bacterium]
MKVLLTIALTALFSTTAIAQDTQDSHYEAAKELLITMNLPAQLEESIEAMIDMQIRQSPEMGMFEDIMKSFLRKHMSWDAIQDVYVGMYMDEFSEEELKEITAFYRTDIGQKFVSKQMPMMQRGMAKGEQIVAENLPELEMMLQQRIEELDGM